VGWLGDMTEVAGVLEEDGEELDLELEDEDKAL
jgi:hypothetical protein